MTVITSVVVAVLMNVNRAEFPPSIVVSAPVVSGMSNVSAVVEATCMTVVEAAMPVFLKIKLLVSPFVVRQSAIKEAVVGSVVEDVAMLGGKLITDESQT